MHSIIIAISYYKRIKLNLTTIDVDYHALNDLFYLNIKIFFQINLFNRIFILVGVWMIFYHIVMIIWEFKKKNVNIKILCGITKLSLAIIARDDTFGD